MSDRKPVWFSEINLVPDPASPEQDKTPLGVLVEGAFGDVWVVGMMVRLFHPKELAQFESVSRSVLERMPELMNREVKLAMWEANGPGEALPILVRRNPWSLRISSPREVPLGVPEIPDTLREKLRELYRHVVGARTGWAFPSAEPLLIERPAVTDEAPFLFS